jgi:hypothetical protein
MTAMQNVSATDQDPDSAAARLDDIANRTAQRYPSLAAELRKIARDFRATPEGAGRSRSVTPPPLT